MYILNICTCPWKYKYIDLETATKFMKFSMVLFTSSFQSILTKLTKKSFKMYRDGKTEELNAEAQI